MGPERDRYPRELLRCGAVLVHVPRGHHPVQRWGGRSVGAVELVRRLDAAQVPDLRTHRLHLVLARELGGPVVAVGHHHRPATPRFDQRGGKRHVGVRRRAAHLHGGGEPWAEAQVLGQPRREHVVRLRVGAGREHAVYRGGVDWAIGKQVQERFRVQLHRRLAGGASAACLADSRNRNLWVRGHRLARIVAALAAGHARNLIWAGERSVKANPPLILSLSKDHGEPVVPAPIPVVPAKAGIPPAVGAVREPPSHLSLGER